MISIDSYEYDRRQFLLMKQSIVGFNWSELELGFLVSRLKALYFAIENRDQQWDEAFLSEWGGLEAVYALYRDAYEQLDPVAAKQFKISDELTSFAIGALNKLSILIEEKVNT